MEYWRKLPSRIKRIWTIVAFFFLSITVTVAGLLTPLSVEDVEVISKELNQTRETIRSMSGFQMTASIFGNNFMICLVTFIPIVGPIFSFYTLYNTGVVIAADSISYGLSPLAAFLSLIVLPFAWMEFLAYSIAFAGSFWLTWRILHRKGKGEIVKTCIFISICALMLLVAAIIEVAIIVSIPQA